MLRKKFSLVSVFCVCCVLMCGVCIHVPSTIPFLVRAGRAQPIFGRTYADVIIAVGFWVVSFLNIWANLMFIVMGILDYSRRVFLMHQCSAMISPENKHWQVSSFQRNIPCLCMNSVENIQNWLSMRLVFKDFGLRW